MRRAHRWACLAALVLVTLPAAGLAGAKMPRFDPALRPLVGTWRHLRAASNGETITLWLVIKEEDGELRLRYQLPVRDKVYTSDWNGRIELEMQVNIEEKRRSEYRVRGVPPGVLVHERIRYSGTSDTPESAIEAVYELDPQGKLAFRCLSFRQGKKSLGCPAPLLYERVSDSTRWPD